VLNNTKTQSRPKLLFLVPAISQTHKILKILNTFFVKTKTKTLGLKTKTKTLFFVLEVPRDQDFGLEDYITDWNRKLSQVAQTSQRTANICMHCSLQLCMLDI